MWFVSQLQNALASTPDDEAFMEMVREMNNEQSRSSHNQNVSDVLSNPRLKITKFSSAPDGVKPKTESCLYSSECMELRQSYPQPRSSKKPNHYHSSLDTKSAFETRECAVLKAASQEKIQISSIYNTSFEPPMVCAKMSCTNYNLKKQGDGDGVQLHETRAKMSQSYTALKTQHSETACNECENASQNDMDEACVKCDSLPAFVPICANKTDSYLKKGCSSKMAKPTRIIKTEENRSKIESPRRTPRVKKLEEKKPDAICLYKRDKDVSGRAKKKADEVDVKAIKSQPAPSPFKKRNELPIHLRPLSPVHDKNSFIRPKSPKLANRTVVGAVKAEVPQVGTEVCRNVKVRSPDSTTYKDSGTSTDLDDLIVPVTVPPPSALTPHSRSSSSKSTKIPVPFQTYCVGYSKISTVEQKFSIISGNVGRNDQCEEAFVRLQKQTMKNDAVKAIEAPYIKGNYQKRPGRRPSSPMRAIRIGKPKVDSLSAVSRFVQPSDLVKRIEMIRRKLAEVGSGKCDDDLYDNGSGVCPYFKLGERGSGIKARGGVQDFYELRDYHYNNGTLFEDPEFPADNSSLTHNGRTDRHYEWLRPSEIVDDPQLFVEGYSRFDVQQGELGDCWLLAAVANLTLYRRLFFQIVPDDQGFDEKYAGIFHFRFWQYGRWIDVVIDDKLPTYRGQLIYLHSNEENEFWSALLEKAYAKLHGSYEALKGGSTCEAMEDFTGGVTEMYEMKSSPPNLFKIILKAYERGSLMGSSLEPDPNVLEAETQEGLIRGHAYSITRVKYVDIRTPNTVGKIPLLRLRNPWGNEIEWNGPWSDQSPEWRFIPDHEKDNLGLTFDHDGEFWMSFKDFQTHFDRLEICNLTPDSLTEEEMSQGNKKQWEMSVFEGEWVRGVTAGGCRNYLETFAHNPQYRITLTEVDDDDDENKCTVIIALMQKNRRSKKQMGVEFLTIGFAVYYLSDPNRAPKPLDLQYFKYNVSVARSPSFINLREVSCRFRLPPGKYCIIPSTFEPNEEGEFLLRVFSEKKNNMEMFDDPIAFKAPKTMPTAAPDKQAEDEKVDEVRLYFLKLAGDDLEIDWEELKDVLDFATKKETANRGFSRDVCKSIVALLDVDRSGKLGFEEFKSLWGLIKNAKQVFGEHDKDNSGSLSGFELRQALNSLGYSLNNTILNILMHRYGNKKAEIMFDEFILCGLKLKTMIETFERKNKNGGQTITLTFEDWIETTLYS